MLAEHGRKLARFAGEAGADDVGAERARVNSQARSTLTGPTQAAYVATVIPCSRRASLVATCSSVAQSGLRCAPHRSIVPKPSARTPGESKRSA